MPAPRTTDSAVREELERLHDTAKSPQLVTPRRGLYVLYQRAPTEFEAALYGRRTTAERCSHGRRAPGARAEGPAARRRAALPRARRVGDGRLLRRDFRAPMVVEELARAVGMSVSSFHEHFKKVTSPSPLQYQKTLRLLEARRRLVAGAATVTAAAFEVGYESPTQFSREYARKFGRSPSEDVASVRAAREAATK